MRESRIKVFSVVVEQLGNEARRTMKPGIALLVVLLFVNILARAQIKIEVRGGKVTQPQQAANTQPSKKLTNQDVIDMAALKLSDDVIIDKIHSTETIGFDTSVAGLKQLRANNVSDAVVRAMINPHPMMAGTSDAAAAKNTSSPYVIPGDGMYIVSAGKLIRLQPETYERKVHINYFAMPVANATQGHMDGRLEGPHSSLRVSTPQQFIIKVQEGYSISDYRLLRLDGKKNHREFRATTIRGSWQTSTNDVEKNFIPFVPEKISDRTWRIQQNLDKGEYGLLSPVGRERSPDASQFAQGSIYTFGVD